MFPFILFCVIIGLVVGLIICFYVLEPMDVFVSDLARGYVRDRWASRYLITRFKVRQETTASGGFKVFVCAPFGVSHKIDTYENGKWDKERMGEDVAKVWKAANHYRKMIKHVPEVVVLPNPADAIDVPGADEPVDSQSEVKE